MAATRRQRCCACNGPNAVCKNCRCVKRSTKCSFCLPQERGKCLNSNVPAQSSTSCSQESAISTRCSDSSNISPVSMPNSTVSLPCFPVPPNSPPSEGYYLGPDEYSSLMLEAYGAPLCYSSTPAHSTEWTSRWHSVTQLSGRHYDLPRGACGRKYVGQLNDEIRFLTNGTFPSERVLFFSAVILQRDKMVKRRCDVIRTLDRRMDLWSAGRFDSLLQEATRCDQLFKTHRRPPDQVEHTKRVFTRLMLQGKVRAATRWLTERSKGSVLLPTDTVSSGSLSVVDALKLKHPSPHPPHSSTLLRPSVVPLFEDLDITGAHIGIIAHRIKGSAGPTGCDSTHWQDVLLRFGCQSQRLRDSLAGLCRRLANSIVDWLSIRALLANRLIALDKSPGIRPIGVGETLRRILGKTICLVSRDDVESVCEVSQLCGGLKCGIESAIHTANDLFQDNDVGMLVIDASNAFNSINRLSLLWNVRVLWPRASRFIFNTYRGWSPLIMKGCSTEILSMEGVTQGDPLSMFVYAIATIPLIHKLNHITGVTQLWYADDSSAIGDLPCLRMWLDLLIKYGPYYGYTPEPHKSSLVVKSDMVNLATSVFGDVGINVVTSCRFLGGIVGSSVGRDEFVSLKVDVWEQHVNLLSDIAKDQPQAAYVALTKSLQNEWSFLQRVVPHCGHHFQQVEKSNFIPSLLGHDITPLDRDLFSLPVRLGGLGIRNPTTTADSLYSTSRHATQLLSNAIMGLGTYSFADHYDLVLSTRSDYLLSQEVIYSQVYDTIFQQSDSMTQRSLTRNKQSLSAWLTTLPSLKDDFNLSSVEFRDADT